MDRAFTFLPSSTLAARSRRHLPQARAWAVHLPSSRPCQHGGGDIGVTVKGFYQPGASSSPRPFELISWTRLRPLPRVCDGSLLLRFLYPDFAFADIDICLLCVAHSGRNRHPGRCACTRFSGSTHVEGQELPSYDRMGCAVSVMCGVVQIGCLCQWWCRTGWTCRDCRLDLASWASVILWKQWGDSTRHFFTSTGMVRGTVRRDLEFWRRLRSAGGQGPLGSFDWRGAWAPRFFRFPVS